jgi:hypothetical protein
MKAGKPKSGCWAKPAPGLKTEFKTDSIEEGFMSVTLVRIPSVVCPAHRRLPVDIETLT